MMSKHNQTVSLYHPEYGIVEYERKQFVELYDLSYSGLYKLISKRGNTYKGWVLAENKDRYQNLIEAIPKADLLTLTHPEYGVHTLLTTEFITRFGISQPSLSLLKCGRLLSCKGWTLPTDNVLLSQLELKQLQYLLQKVRKLPDVNQKTVIDVAFDESKTEYILLVDGCTHSDLS